MPRVPTAFTDTGFAPEEVAVIETKVLLMVKLNDILDATGMTRTQAAKKFGVAQPRVKDLRWYRGDNFSVDALIGMLARTGRHVRVVVGPRE